jgi:hypothetical protein
VAVDIDGQCAVLVVGDYVAGFDAVTDADAASPVSE